MSSASLKTWYLVHKWTSLVSTVSFVLLCLTGLPLIFSHEIDHWFGGHVEPAAMPADAPRASLDLIIADARARRPNEKFQYLFTEADEPNLWLVAMGETADAYESSTLFGYDARTGALLNDYPQGEGFMHWMWKLHVDLFAGLPGTLFIGAMGLLVVAALVSGGVVYGPFMRKLPFGTVRRERSTRTRWLDLHNLLGIATLAWVLVVTVTGVINTLALPILNYWQATELADMTAPYRGRPPLSDLGSIQKALEAVRAADSTMDVSFVAFPGNQFAGPHHYAAFLRGKTPLTSKLLKPVLVDAQTGVVTDQRTMPWYATVLLLSQPLHFGDYGGMPLKILWAVLDVLTILVIGSGLYLWLARSRRRVEERLALLDIDEEAPAAPQRRRAAQ